MAIIEARGLARTFKSRKRTVEAVRGVDLTVGEGEIVGFLGPNGAGKTTTLRMLTTLLKPTAGMAMVAGADLLSNPLEVRKKIGYVPQAIERARTEGDWRPRPSRLCDWCNHKALCPEFGGTPPPLPDRPAEEALPSHQEAIPEPSLPEPPPFPESPGAA